MDESARLEALEAAVLHLRQTAENSLVVVEGLKDRKALRELGIGGHHFVINRGASLDTVIDTIAERMEPGDLARVVLLMDWDRTGGRLQTRFEEGLRARVPVDGECRRRLAQASHVNSVELIPGDLTYLRDRYA